MSRRERKGISKFRAALLVAGLLYALWPVARDAYVRSAGRYLEAPVLRHERVLVKGRNSGSRWRCAVTVQFQAEPGVAPTARLMMDESRCGPLGPGSKIPVKFVLRGGDAEDAWVTSVDKLPDAPAPAPSGRPRVPLAAGLLVLGLVVFFLLKALGWRREEKWTPGPVKKPGFDPFGEGR